MTASDPIRDLEKEDRDLGFGGVVSATSGQRLLNRDGTFNVRRDGLPALRSRSPHHAMLAASWPRFVALLALAYLGIHVVFGLAYFALGPGALHSMATEPGERLLDGFFFSVQTFAGIGYGRLNPATRAADLLVLVESFTGLLGLALATGLVFARWSRPSMKLLWSEIAVVAPYRGGQALMLRFANQRRAQLLEVEARMILTWFDEGGTRTYHRLDLEREKVTLFPLSWTLVHPITRDSPLDGCEEPAFLHRQAEILVLVSATDERTSDRVHARISYRADEVRWGTRFVRMFLPQAAGGALHIDLRKIHDTETVLPEAS